MLIYQEYSLDRYTQFPRGNVVKDTQDAILDDILLLENSNLDGILLIATCVSSTHQDRLIFMKGNVSPTWKLMDREYSFDRHTQFSNKNTVWDTQNCNLEGILIVITFVSSIQQYMPIYPKWMFLPLEDAKR
jgi:hypothetical protein